MITFVVIALIITMTVIIVHNDYDAMISATAEYSSSSYSWLSVILVFIIVIVDTIIVTIITVVVVAVVCIMPGCKSQVVHQACPNSKVHGANTGPTWVLSAPDGPHIGPINLAIRVVKVLKRGSLPVYELTCDWPYADACFPAWTAGIHARTYPTGVMWCLYGNRVASARN